MLSIQEEELSIESVREEQGELLGFKNQEVKKKMQCREDRCKSDYQKKKVSWSDHRDCIAETEDGGCERNLANLRTNK